MGELERANDPHVMSNEIITRVLDALDDIEIGQGRQPSDIERIAIHEHLRAAGISHSDATWMAASCPSLRLARRLYPKETP